MNFRVEEIMVTMRDGVSLATNVWIPDGPPAPALITRLPYGKDVLHFAIAAHAHPDIFDLLRAGYVVIWQDCRGTYRSEGQFTPLIDEPGDGADTAAWAAEQSWCDGNIGLFGMSYQGVSQWATASQTPPSLKAMVPTMTSADPYRSPWHTDGGALAWQTVHFWATFMSLSAEQQLLKAGKTDLRTMIKLMDLMANPTPELNRFPARDQPVLNTLSPWWLDFVDHPDRDAFWRNVAVEDDLSTVTVPALHVGGWFDLFIDSTIRGFTRMQKEGGSVEARKGQRLIVGPWVHNASDGVYPDRQFGLTASGQAARLTDAHIAFFDRWIRDDRPSSMDESLPVRIFVMGLDVWRDEPSWPLHDTRYTDFYLTGSARANTSRGGGVLSVAVPQFDAVDSYEYDPAYPVPSVGGRTMNPVAVNGAGPADQRQVEDRDDVLCYTTAAFDEPLEVTGHISLTLFVSSSARDTDFTGKLIDVHPDGRALYLTDGILRARYRQGVSEPVLLDRNEVYEVTIDLSVTSNVFLPGHRLRLEISSSNFPRYDRNTNSGNIIAEDSVRDLVVATNSVHHGRKYPSRLVLPLIER